MHTQTIQTVTKDALLFMLILKHMHTVILSVEQHEWGTFRVHGFTGIA